MLRLTVEDRMDRTRHLLRHRVGIKEREREKKTGKKSCGYEEPLLLYVPEMRG